jgi:hypothetical protein
MSDPGGCTLRHPPTAREVVGRLKDDGDFDALRRAIVRKVKDNVSFLQTSIPQILYHKAFRFRRSWSLILRTCHAVSLNSSVDWSLPLLDSILCLIVCKVAIGDPECRVSVEFRPFGLKTPMLYREHFRLNPG